MAAFDGTPLTKQQIRVKRTIILVLSLLLLFIVGLSTILISRYFDDAQSRLLIYGVWEEQYVPKFAQDKFEVREEAVYINERIVDTKYTFDGFTLTYEYEGKQYEYQVLDEHTTELQRVAPLHYESVFHIRGKEKQDEELTSEELVFQ